MNPQSPPLGQKTSAFPPAPVLTALLGLMSMFGPVSTDMYLPALPIMETALETNTAAIQLTLGGFLTGFGLSLLFYGPLSDSFGRRPVALAGILLYLVSSLFCAMAESIHTLIVVRILQGIGASAGPIMAQVMVRDLYERDQSARVYSILTLLMGIAPMAAPVIGEQLLTFFGWRAIFWGVSGFGAVCLTLAYWLLPETLPTNRGSSQSSLRIALRHYHELVRSRIFLSYSLSAGCATAALFTYLAGAPHVYITVMGLSPQNFSVLFGINIAGIMVLSMVNGWTVTRFGVDRLLRYGLLLILFGASLLLVTANFDLFGVPGIAAPLFLILAALGIVRANATAGALASHPAMAGAAAALAGVIPYLIGFAAIVLLGQIHANSARPMAYIIFGLAVTSFLSHRILSVHKP